PLIGALVAIGVAASIASASGPPNMSGTYKVTGTVTGTNIAGDKTGNRTHDTYKFKSKCQTAACTKYQLTRTDGAAPITSIVKEVKPGVYKGTEGPAPYTCLTPLGKPGSYTGKNT